MKSDDLKNKNMQELRQLLVDLRTKMVKLSFELEAHTLKDTSQIRKIKMEIARILTELSKRKST